MKRFLCFFAACCAVYATSSTVALFAGDQIPAIQPNDVGISEEALEALSDHVSSLVEESDVVGAEIHVIKNRKTVLHRAFGMADREAKRELTSNSIYCVRSMTKPLIGTAIQMLLDEGKLRLDQPVHEILPEFDRPQHRKILIGHLLTHKSGLPFSTIHIKGLDAYQSLKDVADEAAQTRLEFVPGKSFQYSDTGTDTLTAVIAAVTGKPAETFVRERILEPLKMNDSYPLLSDGADRSRIPTAYSGGSGSWKPHWTSSDEPIFSYFLGSQGLYSTTSDYARFLMLWMDHGTHNGEQLLSVEAVDRGLESGSRMRGYKVGFDGLSLSYGQLWMVYHKNDEKTPVVFGHNGSDGTYAWAWPEEDLIVLFFTQSRGTVSGMGLESVVDRLIFKNDVEGYRRDRVAMLEAKKMLHQFEGLYWDEDADDAYYVVSEDKGKLVFERPGRLRQPVKSLPEKGKFTIENAIQLEFELDSEPSPAVLMTTRRRTERQARHEPNDQLPELTDVMSKVQQAHGVGTLEADRVIKLSGTIKTGPFATEGTITQWIGRRGLRVEYQLGGMESTVIITADEVIVERNGKVIRLEGVERLQEVIGHHAIQFGDWQRGYDQLQVLKRLDDPAQLMVWAKADGLPSSTFFIDEETGRVVRSNGNSFVTGVGYVGTETQYGDFRKIDGVTLPFKVETSLSNRLLGKTILTITDGETIVDPTGLFKVPQDQDD